MQTPWERRPILQGGELKTLPLLLALFLLFSARVSAQGPDPLHQLSNSVEDLVKRVSPSVVQIIVAGFGPLGGGNSGDADSMIGRQRNLASGVIVDPEGYIITNAHVVKNAQRVEVILPSPPSDLPPIRSLNARGRTAEARVVGVAEEIDLALLKIDVRGLPALPFGNYDKLRQGELVFAFGSPQGLQNSVTMGVVSAVARQLDPDSPLVFIQTDASINPGNSGGPLVNIDGELVGINTSILSQSGGNEGLGFAIPSAVVGFAYPQLRKFGHVHRGEIGVMVQTITPNLAVGLSLPKDFGVMIADVIPGGSGEKAGLKVQDIIVSVDGKSVESLPIFTYALFVHGPGDRIRLNLLRGSEKLQLTVPVNERPHGADQFEELADPEKNVVRRLGILGIEIDSKIASLLPSLRIPSGIIVAAKSVGAESQENSLAAGDVIHSLNGSTVTSLVGLRSGLDVLKPGSPIVLQIEREGRLQFISF